MKCKICHNPVNSRLLDIHELKLHGDKTKYSLEMILEKVKVCEECYGLEVKYLSGHIEKAHEILTTGRGNHKEVASEIRR